MIFPKIPLDSQTAFRNLQGNKWLIPSGTPSKDHPEFDSAEIIQLIPAGNPFFRSFYTQIYMKYAAYFCRKPLITENRHISLHEMFSD